MDERAEVIAFEEGHPAAILTEQKVLVPVAFGDECLASLRLVDALNEMKFFKFFECAINRDQPKRIVLFTCHIEDFDRGEARVDF